MTSSGRFIKVPNDEEEKRMKDAAVTFKSTHSSRT
jgi:hypothetical protein